MRSSDSINELAAALAKAQAEMQNAAFNKENPHFRSKYADLAAVRDATVPYLTKHGLSIVQFPLPEGEGWNLHTVLMHSSGQWLEGMFPLAADFTQPQKLGSFLTYARRYSHAGMCGIASEEDDDANAASTEPKAKPKPKDAPIKFDDEESATKTEALIESLASTKTPRDVDDFAKEHAAIYARLKTEHQQTVAKATSNRRAELSKSDGS